MKKWSIKCVYYCRFAISFSAFEFHFMCELAILNASSYAKTWNKQRKKRQTVTTSRIQLKQQTNYTQLHSTMRAIALSKCARSWRMSDEMKKKDQLTNQASTKRRISYVSKWTYDASYYAVFRAKLRSRSSRAWSYIYIVLFVCR